MIDRRQLLQGAVSASAAASVTGPAIAAARKKPFFRSHGLPLGIQLYTLADMATADLPGTLRKVAKVGYQTVELASYFNRSAKDLRAELDAAGLKCPSSHIMPTPFMPGAPSLDGDLGKIADDAHVIGIKTIVMPIFRFPPGASLPTTAAGAADFMAKLSQVMTVDGWHRCAEFMNKVAATLKQHGLRFGYHNHNIEFAPLPGGGTGLELLLENTDPSLVGFEMDAGWAVAGGHDPVALLRKYPGRFRQMHVKDVKPTTKTNYEFKQDPAEVGRGVIDWHKILPVAYADGVREFYVEQEPPYEIDPLAAVTVSYKYLSTLVA